MQASQPPSSAVERKAADADLVGEAATLRPPGADQRAEAGLADAPALPAEPLMPEPPPAEDENQPGFIGERNRPAP